MSWLFDQLSAIAEADAVEVVIAADVAEELGVPGSIDLARLLVRSAFMPGLSIQFLSSDSTTSTLPLRAEESIDLGTMDLGSAARKIRSLLNTHRKHRSAVLRVKDTTATLEAFGRLPRPTRDHDDGDVQQTRRVFATDRAGDEAMLTQVSTTGLAVAVGGSAPSATVRVDDMSGFVAILDALVTLRGQVFGIEAPRAAKA